MTRKSSLGQSPFVPLKEARSPVGLGCVLVAGVLLIACSAHIQIPMVPVPMSLQTYAVVLIGGLAGRRLAGAVLLLYLVSGALGAPVFADGASGADHLVGMTAGYLFGFLFAAMLVGALAERGWTSSPFRSILAMVIGHGVILGLGAIVLGLKADWVTAYEGGFRPFLLGGLAKSVLAAATILLLQASRSKDGAKLWQARRRKERDTNHRHEENSSSGDDTAC